MQAADGGLDLGIAVLRRLAPEPELGLVARLAFPLVEALDLADLHAGGEPLLDQRAGHRPRLGTRADGGHDDDEARWAHGCVSGVSAL
jgi:hypothetical protein